MATQPMGWRVTSQEHREQYTSNGRFEKVVTVHIATATGTPAQFDFPEAQYNVENVVNTINAWAEREAVIGRLGNE